MRTKRLVVAIGLSMLVAAACGGEGDTSTPAGGGSSSAPSGEAGSLSMSGFAFVPGDVTTGTGGTLSVTNEDSTTHTFTMDDGSVDQQVGAGQTVEVTITAAGSFHCDIHPSMTGAVSLGS
ncbi:MAG: cupredoxin domain-containing protein [Actinomycetota bacterium]